MFALTHIEIENETRADYENFLDIEFSEVESSNMKEAKDLDCKNEMS